jgi:hypothetical protein
VVLVGNLGLLTALGPSVFRVSQPWGAEVAVAAQRSRLPQTPRLPPDPVVTATRGMRRSLVACKLRRIPARLDPGGIDVSAPCSSLHSWALRPAVSRPAIPAAVGRIASRSAVDSAAAGVGRWPACDPAARLG